MYKILLVFFASLTLNFLNITFAYDTAAYDSVYDHSFTLSGEDEIGNSVEGIIYFNNAEKGLRGKITDQSGHIYEFTGHWVWPGLVWPYIRSVEE